MAYRKVPAQVRTCAFCSTEFEATHRGRLYCSGSCNTRACKARKAQQPVSEALAAPTVVVDPRPAASPVTLANNVQNWTMLTVAPQLPKLAGAALQFLGDLFTPTASATGPSTWLPAALRQVTGPLVILEHASWQEPRFFVELAYEGHTLYYRAAHELLVLREPAGTLRQLCTVAEFSALLPAPKSGLAALLELYAPDFIAPVRAPLVAAERPSLGPANE